MPIINSKISIWFYIFTPIEKEQQQLVKNVQLLNNSGKKEEIIDYQWNRMTQSSRYTSLAQFKKAIQDS
ncbi:hypothetical protein BpHYR1_035343 [Brachionus plicatilis]|uniref:Uncharacterized protein n=1 Tax=Brachionus plicatilis TaxID=10195 RepID=A0A3M7PQF1_BRAPC|nr:hypothetical protein BpHYR1_035343 [Brachionus plicatilis]